MKNTTLKLATSAVLVVSAYAVWAHMAPAAPAAQSAAAPVDMAEGEVRKIDKESKKVTLKHGPIKNLDMPGMTMVFQVKDAAMLDSFKAGDKVKFKAEQTGRAYFVTEIEPAK